MSSVPPLDEGPIEPIGAREGIVRDRTPEQDDIDRAVTPVGRTRAGISRLGVGAGLAAVIAALLLINFGGQRARPAANTIAMTPDAKARPDQRAKQDVPFEASAQPTAPGGIGALPGQTMLPDGTVVPAIDPNAVPGGGAGGPPAESAETLADKVRRAPLLVSVPDAEARGDAVRAGDDGISGEAAGAADGQSRSGEAPGELDRLRRSTAIGTSRANQLPARDYLITAGTLIPCILQTAMNSTQPGYTSCLVPRNVYSDNGRVVLLEKGTKVLGQYQGGLNQGQGRIFVLWTRAVTPRGVAVELASPASDALGRAGMAGGVETFFWARFGAALMLSLVDDASAIASSRVANEGSNITQVPSNTAGTALNNTINIKPVLTKNQGEEVAIFVAQDFDFADVYRLRLKP